ncbi:MAG: hypothetical protein CO119_04975 [Flavobacteriales bacterium CG_4_9_14_3_um_filter_40_17]|nr:MAG: hypothetical protein CO119_04975 [Flavobacteriales bacterium CG_4_9_14_3_um_filter_40_17]
MFPQKQYNLGVPPANKGGGLSVPIFFWAEKPKKRISTSIPNANFIYILVSIIFHQLFFLETLIFARLTK